MGKTDKLAKKIQEIAADVILYKLNDPRIKFVTVTKAKLSDDLRYCTIYVSAFGTAAQVRTTMRGIKHARGFIQSQIASRVSLRNAPIVNIARDDSLEKGDKVAKLIDEIHCENEDRDGENEIE